MPPVQAAKLQLEVGMKEKGETYQAGMMSWRTSWSERTLAFSEKLGKLRQALAAAEANALQARDGLRVLWVWRPSGSYEAAKKELEKSLQEKEEAGSHRDLNLTNSKAGWERQKRAPTQKPKSCRQEQCQNQ